MRFALFGDHPDGVAFAKALATGARHEVVTFAGAGDPPIGVKKRTRDIEEALADPDIQAVIVAVPVRQRLDVTRRVLQSERHAAVVHPVDFKPDGAHELSMLQGDVHQALLPLLPEAFSQPIPPCELIDLEFTDPVNPLLAIDDTGRHPVFAGWTLLRRMGGEIAEVSAFARTEEAEQESPVLLSGKFATGQLFRTVHRRGAKQPASPEWAELVVEFERAVEALATAPRAEPAAGAEPRPGARVAWFDEIRALELDDAAARSLRNRRASLLDYQEASEAVGFRGTMTLLGCGMLWMLLLVLIAAAFYPPLFWISVPILFGFLALQLLRWVVPTKN